MVERQNTNKTGGKVKNPKTGVKIEGTTGRVKPIDLLRNYHFFEVTDAANQVKP
jgi:hypothetical protein